MNKCLLVYVGFLIAFLAPHFISIVARQAWPLWVKRIAALVLVVPFVAMMGYALARPLPFGSNVPEPLVDGFLVLYLAWTLFGATREWPRAGGQPEPIKDIRALLSTTIPAAESQLGLTVVERSERRHPPEGVYSHYLTRYSDGTWLEWLNPTDEKGEPIFSFYALYSNNKALVRVLAKALAPSCNVERTDRPLWRGDE